VNYNTARSTYVVGIEVNRRGHDMIGKKLSRRSHDLFKDLRVIFLEMRWYGLLCKMDKMGWTCKIH